MSAPATAPSGAPRPSAPVPAPPTAPPPSVPPAPSKASPPSPRRRPVPTPAPSVLSRARRAVVGFFRNDDRGTRLLISLALAVAFVGTIYYWTRGALLYGADNIGIYRAGDFWASPHSDYILPSLAAWVFPNNPSHALYLSTGMEAFCACFAAQFFTRQLLRRSFTGGRLLAAGAIAAGLYLVSPVAISYWYVGLLTNLNLSSSAYFVVLGFLVKFLKSISTGRRFGWLDTVLLGLAAGLSAPDSIPNEIRMIGITLVLFLGAVVIALGAFRRTPAEAKATYASVARIVVVGAPIAAVLLFYPLYLFITSPGFNLHSVGSVAAYYSTRFTSTSYNTIWATLRLEGRVTFQHTLYYYGYSKNPLMILASFAWPALALVVPAVIVAAWEFPDRLLVSAALLISVPGVLWEAGSNPPFGTVHDQLTALLPYGDTLLQTYSLTLILLSKLFPALVAFSVVTLGNFAGQLFSSGGGAAGAASSPGRASVLRPPFDSDGRRHSGWGRISGILLATGLTAVIAASALPIYNGQVERTTWAPDQEGFEIPSAYAEARAALLNGSTPTVLLLPEIDTYFTTSWGYNGANGFYTNFYYPASFIVPRYYGEYALFVNNTAQNYSIATNPLVPQMPTERTLNLSFPSIDTARTATATGGLRYSFGASKAFSITGSTWLQVQLPYTNTSFLPDAVAAGNVWVGVQTEAGGVAWYVLGSASNALVPSMSNGTLTADLLLDAPDSGSPANLSRIGGISVQIREPARTFGVVSAPISVEAIQGSNISTQWLGMMRGLGVSYLMVDWTISAGAAEPRTLVNDTLVQLADRGYLYPDFTSSDLVVYRLATGG